MIDVSGHAAIVGIGHSKYGKALPESQLALGAQALRAALDDAGLTRDDVNGLAIHLGWPVGVDYDRVAEAYGLRTRWANQAWLHGRFAGTMLQAAVMAVACGLADVVACVTAISFSRERQHLGSDDNHEASRDDGGSHGEAPHVGLTSPMAGAALAMQRYMALHGATGEQLAAVAVSARKHAQLSPHAVVKKPLTTAQHQESRMVMDPLRLLDCCPITDGAAVLLVASPQRARDLRSKPVRIVGMQGIRAGRDEFVFAPPSLGINQQSTALRVAPETEIYHRAGVARDRMDAFYTYDSFSPLVLFALERFGFCGRGEAAQWIQGGRIEPGGELPVNTSGGVACRGPHVRVELHHRDRPPAARRSRGAAVVRCAVPAVGNDLGRLADLYQAGMT
jgi:acetyl-CoA acetyltransferase